MVAVPRLVGMVHLGPLPDAPRFRGDLAAVVDAAVADASTLVAAGFDAVMVENFGDSPFHADQVPPATVAAMTRAVSAVVDAVSVPVGVNVLRNDAVAALAIAAATGARMVRVNVLSGTMYTDQGPIVGRAAEVARARARWCPDVAILADVFVKHAVPPPGLRLVDAARDLAERGGADALVVSGAGTGSPTDPVQVEAVAAVAGCPVLVGSGATPETVADLLRLADGVIVGSALKVESDPTAPVDPGRARRFVLAATGGA